MTTQTISLSLQKDIVSMARAAVHSITEKRYPKSFRSDETEDIAGDTIFKAIRYFDKYDASRNLFSWIYKIAENCVKDALERKAAMRHPRYDDDFDTQVINICGRSQGAYYEPDSRLVGDSDASIAGAIDARQMEDIIDDEISQMCETDRRIYAMLENGFKPRQIAETLGVSADCVSVRKFRMYHSLQKRLSPWASELGACDAA